VTRPVLALDVDGVLNAEVGHMRELVRVAMREEWVTSLTNPGVVGKELELRIDRARDAQFLAAIESLGVEIVWCTTWEGAANEVIGPLYGLGPRDVLAVSEFVPERGDPVRAKVAAIEHHFPDRPVLWLDDLAWLVRYVWRGRADRKIVAPAAQWGLRRDDRERVLRWFMEVTGGEPRRARDVLREAGVPDGSLREIRVLGAGEAVHP
jgi:hypothetical protein